MSPPIDIDGSEIQEATIDGQNVSEITIDGQQAARLRDIPDSALTQDLVAWYRFEDGDARDYTNDLDATFADSTAYDGTVNGATHNSSGGVTDFKTDASSGFFDFDGSNDDIQVTNIDNSNWSNGYTFMCWMNVDAFGTREQPLNISTSGGDDGGALGRYQSFADLIEFNHDDGSTFHRVTIKSAPPTGQWIHIAGSWDGSTLKTFYNGSDTGNSASVAGWEVLNDNNFDFSFGVRVDGPNYFDGGVDDARLYNRALSATEVANIVNQTQP